MKNFKQVILIMILALTLFGCQTEPPQVNPPIIHPPQIHTPVIHP